MEFTFRLEVKDGVISQGAIAIEAAVQAPKDGTDAHIFGKALEIAGKAMKDLSEPEEGSRYGVSIIKVQGSKSKIIKPDAKLKKLQKQLETLQAKIKGHEAMLITLGKFEIKTGTPSIRVSIPK